MVEVPGQGKSDSVNALLLEHLKVLLLKKLFN